MNAEPEVISATVLNRAWTDTYEQIAVKARQVRGVLESRKVRLRPGSALSLLLKQADILSETWDKQKNASKLMVFEAAHVNRLADAIIFLGEEPGIQESLRRMAGSIMQPDDRSTSQGKDALWEVVLLADLKKNGCWGIAAEPDIVVDFGMGRYPIACKKIWSEGGVEKHVSKGTKQLAPFENGGLIALNLDDLLLAGHEIKAPNGASALRCLKKINVDFLNKHKSILQRVILEGKCDGFLISTTAVAVLGEDETSIHLANQTLLWQEKASVEAVERFRAFTDVQSGLSSANIK